MTDIKERIMMTEAVLRNALLDAVNMTILTNQLAIMKHLQTLPDKEDLRISQIKVNPRRK